MKILNLARCLIFGHKWKTAGSCPFTMKTYNACLKCYKTIEIQKGID